MKLGATHFGLRHGLAEGDGGGFDDTVAPAAMRQGAVALEGQADGVEFVAGPALQAVRIGRIAVDFDDAVLGDPCGLVEAVDVLGDEGAGTAGGDKMGAGAVASIGAGGAQGGVGGEFAAPGLAAHVLGGDEVTEIDGFHLRPDAAGAAEIGDPRFGGDASAGEQGDARGGGEFAREGGNGVWALHEQLPIAR